MTLRQIMNALKGYEDQNREQWSMVRRQCYYSLLSMRGGKEIGPENELFWIPGDKPIERIIGTITKTTNEEAAERFRAFKDKEGNRVYSEDWITKNFG
jgi:hypothetical protein